MARLLGALLTVTILVGPTTTVAASPTVSAPGRGAGLALASPSSAPATNGSDGMTLRQWVALAAAVALALGLTMRFAAGRQLRRAHGASQDRDRR
jgi:hypothetical protein